MHASIGNDRRQILGFAFKKDTGDVRETPALMVLGTPGNVAELALGDGRVGMSETCSLDRLDRGWSEKKTGVNCTSFHFPVNR